MAEIERALQSAQDFIHGQTPDDMALKATKEQVLQTIEEALSNHVPSVRSRLA